MADKNTKIPDPDYYYGYAERKTAWDRGDLKRAIDFIREKFLGGEVKKILEVGCGMAGILEHIPREIDYYGLDPAEICIETTKKKYPNAFFELGYVEKVPFADNLFDLIFSHQVLEMLNDPQQGLKEMMRVVRPGGYVVIIAPNLEVPWSEIHAVRHYTKLRRLILLFQRFGDLFFRLFGRLRFRTLDQSHMQATGKFEKSDDDLKYITSAYEVATFFKRHGFIELERKNIHYPSNSPKNFLKNIIIKIPIFKYYNSGMFFVFKKNSK